MELLYNKTIHSSITIDPWPKFKYIVGVGYRILTPAEKMPDCPECKHDELTFVQEKTIICMACHKWFIKKD